MERAREELPAELVALRRWRDDGADELFRVATDALPHLRPWMAWAAGGYTMELAREHLADVRRSWDQGQSYDYAIRLPDGALIGSCSLMARIGPGGLEIGYWLHPTHTGRGYATSAVAALAAEAFRIGGRPRGDRARPGQHPKRRDTPAARVHRGGPPTPAGGTHLRRGGRGRGVAVDRCALAAAGQWFWW